MAAGASADGAAEGRPQPPQRVNNLSLVDGKTFSATTVTGDIVPPGSADVGLFHRDTRFLSWFELRVRGHHMVVLSSGTQANLRAQIEMAASSAVASDGADLPESTLYLRREQLLADCFYEQLTIENFHLRAVEIELEWCFDADFADIFQVRGQRRRRSGTHRPPHAAGDTIAFSYLGRDQIERRTTLHFAPPPDELAARRACFRLALEPHERRQILVDVRAQMAGDGAPPAADFARGWKGRQRAFEEWRRGSTVFESSHGVFDQCLESALSDFFALRIPEADGGETLAAGIPWFATVFGRDSLIASYQSLLLHPDLARQTLRFLARWQGRQRDDWREEEPGKILHEFREGEMTRAGEMPHSPYFGSVDSTPLFLIVLAETYNWTGDRALLEELLPAARAAMEWIERDGDVDGDGLVEYRKRSPLGLENQGWKDSADSSLHRDGRPAPPPIALCEVQGYCYDARYRFSRLLRAMGDGEGAERLRQQAAELAQRFERAFWMPQSGYYAMALDGDKHQQQVIASNAGHLLWSRMVSQERARQVANRLLRADMFSGWGVRTLSAAEATFNPLSYHRGSVWPHDNSLIGEGLAFYGMKPALMRLFTGLFQAAAHFPNLRLPELFVGVERRDFDEPVRYPVSCSPQAWASGAMLLLLTAALGIRPNAAKRELRIIDPTLPEWLDWLRVRNLHVGTSLVSLEFSRRGPRTFCNVIDLQGDRLAVSVDFTKAR